MTINARHTLSRVRKSEITGTAGRPIDEMEAKMPIKRIWHGWTDPDRADEYQALLNGHVFPGIEAKGIEGYQGVTLLRRDLYEEVEFVTIMEFSRIEDVIAFQGEDYERCYVPDAARRVLKRWDERSAHFEIIVGGNKNEQAAR